MFSKLFVVSTILAAAFAHDVKQCNSGTVHCCNSAGFSDDASIAKEMGLLGVVVQGVHVPVALQCSPVDAIALGSGNACNRQAVCCKGNSYNGLVNVGCSPITL